MKGSRPPRQKNHIAHSSFSGQRLYRKPSRQNRSVSSFS